MLHSLVSIESGPAASVDPNSTRPAMNSSNNTSNSAMDLPSPALEIPARPAKAVSRTYAAVPLKDNSVARVTERPVSSSRAFDASDLERSRPVTPVQEADEDIEDAAGSDNSPDDSHDGALGTDDEGDGVEALHGIFDPYMNRYRLAVVSLVNLANGLNDSAAGALLPYIERHYDIGYAIVSLIFVGLAVGSIMAATCVDAIKRRLGRGRTLALAQVLMAVGYIPMLTMAAPFPVVVVGFFAVGFGEAVNLAMGNTFCASLRQSTLALGIMHGTYGIGGISGPLIATAAAVATGAATNPDIKSAAPFAHYYFVPFSLVLLTAALGAWSFAGFEKDIGEDLHDSRAGDNNNNAARMHRLRRWRNRPQINQAALRRPQPMSAPSTAPSSRAPSPSPPTSPLVPTLSRPGLSPLQSSQKATPLQSFSSSAPLFNNNVTSSAFNSASNSRSPSTNALPLAASPYSPTTPTSPASPIAPSAAAASAAPSRRRRVIRHRSFDRLYDMFTRSSSKVVLLGALFIFSYQGSEVSIAGWVTSFLIADRGGKEPAVGYITAGFWAGITLGRFLLVGMAQRVGERRFVYACVVGAAAFELLVWFVPNVIGDAVAVSIVGLLLGPVYPCSAHVLMKGMSRRERVTGVSVIAAFGSAGGAAAPFITGVVSQAAGTFVLHPIAIGLFALMILFWSQVPMARKRTD